VSAAHLEVASTLSLRPLYYIVGGGNVAKRIHSHIKPPKRKHPKRKHSHIKRLHIKEGGATARGVTSWGLFHFRIKDPPYRTPPLTPPHHTYCQRGGGVFFKGGVYSTTLNHLPSNFILSFILRGVWVMDTPASKFASCSGTCSHGRGPS